MVDVRQPVENEPGAPSTQVHRHNERDDKMNTSLNHGSAKIYQFPAGGRAALGGRRYDETKTDTDQGSPRMNDSSAAAAGITKRQSRNPSRHGSVNAYRKSNAEALLVFETIIKCVKEGRNKNVSALFSCQLAGRHRSLGVLDRGACLGDFQRDAAARIARTGQRQALGQASPPCHRSADGRAGSYSKNPTMN